MADEDLVLSGPNRSQPYVVRRQIKEFALDAMKGIARGGVDLHPYLQNAKMEIRSRVEAWCRKHGCNDEETAYMLEQYESGFADASSQYQQIAQTSDMRRWHGPPRPTMEVPRASHPEMETAEQRAYWEAKEKAEAEAVEAACEREAKTYHVYDPDLGVYVRTRPV